MKGFEWEVSDQDVSLLNALRELNTDIGYWEEEEKEEPSEGFEKGGKGET